MRGGHTRRQRPVWRNDLLKQADKLCDEHPMLVPPLAEFASCCRKLSGRELYRGLVRVAHEGITDGHLALQNIVAPSNETERGAFMAVQGVQL
jgi:hypothetical protein